MQVVIMHIFQHNTAVANAIYHDDFDMLLLVEVHAIHDRIEKCVAPRLENCMAVKNALVVYSGPIKYLLFIKKGRPWYLSTVVTFYASLG